MFNILQKNPKKIEKDNNVKGKKFYIRESYYYLKIRALPEAVILLKIMQKNLGPYVIRDLTTDRLKEICQKKYKNITEYICKRWFRTLKKFGEEVEGGDKYELKKIALEVKHQANALTFPLLRKTMNNIKKVSNHQEYIWYLSNMKAQGKVKGIIKDLTLDNVHRIGEKRKFDLEGIGIGIENKKVKKIMFKTF